MKWLKDLLYSRGNKYADIARVSSIALIAAYIGLSIAEFYTNRNFDHVLFSAGATTLMGGCGTWVHWRKKTEPPEIE